MYLEKYLSQLNNQGLETSVLDVSKQIDDNVKKFFTFKDNVTGLLFGNVQSGKTAQMLGAIARFADEGYMIFLLLTSDNVDLQRQTFLRTQSSLIDFNVLSERDDLKFLQDGLRKPTVIVLKSITGRDPNNPDALDLSKGYNIVVGGNTLGRGITFPHLQIVYYCRASKTPQADTFWQHSRIFGYDREASLVRIFIPKSLYKLFSELSKANMVLIKQIEDRGIDGVQLIYPKGVRPTRSNVLDNKFLQMLSGGVNIFPNEPIGGNTKQIDPLVMDYKDSKVQEVSEELILKLLDNVGSLYREDFDSETYKNCVRALSKKRPKMKYRLIVRIDRDIAKGTGTLLSPNDRALGDNYQNDVVLTLYRLNGDVSKGWNGNPLWVPNIKFPSDCCFYNAE